MEMFGARALIQRCREHKKRNVTDALPERLRAAVRSAMNQASAAALARFSHFLIMRRGRPESERPNLLIRPTGPKPVLSENLAPRAQRHRLRRRGFEMRLVIQGNRAPASLADFTLIKAIARRRQWADDLIAGRVESAAAIAKREGVLPNYVRRLTRLAFLAPRIVEAIVAGHQPPELTAKALTERVELPLLWSEQEHAEDSVAERDVFELSGDFLDGSKSCKNVKPSPGVENGPAGSNSSRRSVDFRVNLGAFLISCVKQLPHHLQRHTALAGFRLRVGLGVA